MFWMQKIIMSCFAFFGVYENKILLPNSIVTMIVLLSMCNTYCNRTNDK